MQATSLPTSPWGTEPDGVRRPGASAAPKPLRDRRKVRKVRYGQEPAWLESEKGVGRRLIGLVRRPRARSLAWTSRV